MNHNFDSTCNCQKCDKNFLQADFEIYSLTLHKTCNTCNTYFKADKPWYFNCKDCSGRLPFNNHYKTTQCIYCKELFYRDVKVLNIVSGYYEVRHNYRTDYYNTYRKIIPSHLIEDEKKITQGTYFCKEVCLNHLSQANKHITKLSCKKALRWSRMTSYPSLFRLKCLKISFIHFNEQETRCKILTALLTNKFLPELRQLILKLYFSL